MTNNSELGSGPLLLCIDLENGSKQLIKDAADYAQRCGLTTYVLYISNKPLNETTRMRVLTRLHDLTDQPFADLNSKIVDIEFGIIEEMIIKVASYHNARLIMLGRRQRSRVDRIHVGSTTSAVISLASRPVLVVPVDHNKR